MVITEDKLIMMKIKQLTLEDIDSVSNNIIEASVDNIFCN